MIHSDSTWSEFMVHVVVTTRHKLVYAVPLQPGHAMACVGTTKSGTELLQLCLGWDNHFQIKQICSHFSDTAQVLYQRNCCCLFLMIWCVVSTQKKMVQGESRGTHHPFLWRSEESLGNGIPGSWMIIDYTKKTNNPRDCWDIEIYLYIYIWHIISPK